MVFIFVYYNKICNSLLGHNGAGKTTTINCLTGMIEHEGGSVYVNGKELYSNLTEIR